MIPFTKTPFRTAVLLLLFGLPCGMMNSRGQNTPSQPAAAPAAAVGSAKAAGPLDGLLLGTWTYRSFRNNPTPNTPFNDLRFGEGMLVIEDLSNGVFKGRLDFGPEAQVALTGMVSYGNPATLQFQGRGTSAGNKDWLYDYVGHLAFQWPQGEKQVPALVGTIVRSQPHSGGAAPAGVVASWIALKVGSAESARLAPRVGADGMKMAAARDGAGSLERSELQKLWADFAAGKPAPESRAASL